MTKPAAPKSTRRAQDSSRIASLISDALEGASYATKWSLTRGRASFELTLASPVARHEGEYSFNTAIEIERALMGF